MIGLLDHGSTVHVGGGTGGEDALTIGERLNETRGHSSSLLCGQLCAVLCSVFHLQFCCPPPNAHTASVFHLISLVTNTAVEPTSSTQLAIRVLLLLLDDMLSSRGVCGLFFVIATRVQRAISKRSLFYFDDSLPFT